MKPLGILASKAKRRTGIAIVVTGTAAATVVSLLLPKWYESEIAVVAAQSNKGMLGGGLAAMAGELPIDIGLGGGEDAERIQAILRSRSVTDAVIQKFDLQKRYDEKYIEFARKKLWDHCSTRLDKKSRVVTLSCEDKDPKVAQQMCEFFGEYGNEVFRRVSASSAHEERRFLEQRVHEAKNDVDSISSKLRDFEEANHIIDLPEQAKAVVSGIANLQGDMLSKQLELSYLSSFSSAQESTAGQLRQQVAVLENKMKSLEGDPAAQPGSTKKSKEADKRSSLFPAAMTVPKLRSELTALYRQQKIAETVFFLLTQRYEMAKVNEARDTSEFQIVDHAALPTYKSRPHRIALVLAGLFASLLIAWAWLQWGEVGLGTIRDALRSAPHEELAGATKQSAPLAADADATRSRSRTGG